MELVWSLIALKWLCQNIHSIKFTWPDLIKRHSVVSLRDYFACVQNFNSNDIMDFDFPNQRIYRLEDISYFVKAIVLARKYHTLYVKQPGKTSLLQPMRYLGYHAPISRYSYSYIIHTHTHTHTSGIREVTPAVRNVFCLRKLQAR